MKLYVGDAAYDVPSDFTYRELATFQRVAGVRPADLEEAFTGGDSLLIVALAVVAAKRSGDDLDPEQLLDLEAGAIRLEGDEDRPTELPANDDSVSSDGTPDNDGQ